MDAKLFVEKLSRLSPNQEDLRKIGFSDEDIEVEINYFNALEKEKSKYRSYSNQIFSLIKNFDLSNVLIANTISFLEEVEEVNNVLCFGYTINGTLAIDLETNEVIEFSMGWDFRSYCAKNASNFLSALLAVAEFHSNWVTKKIIDNNVKLSFLNRSVIEAGGPKYLSFFKELF